MSSIMPQPQAATIVACTVSRDVQNFDLLIEDMEAALGESWGDLSFAEALAFFGQPEAEGMEFIALALENHVIAALVFRKLLSSSGFEVSKFLTSASDGSSLLLK